MKRLLLASATILIAAPAFGADLHLAQPLKAPIASPAYDWSGFYAGINAGGGWGATQTTGNSASDSEYSGSLNNLAISQNALQGLIAGGQFGYNYQFAFAGMPIVAGLEIDGDWSGVQGTVSCAPVTANCSQSDKLTWTADVTGRVGYAWQNFLPYFKAGVVWGSFNHNLSASVGNSTNVTGSASNTATGFLIGAGLEYALSQHLTAKLEYNFLDFGTQTENINFSGSSLGSVTVNGSFKDQVQVFKGGLNYKF